MNYFKFNLEYGIKVAVVGREHLVPPRLHRERKTDYYILYYVTEGSLELQVDGRNVMLSKGDVYIFNKGSCQKPVKSCDCEYYFAHFDSLGAGCCDDDNYIENLRQKNIDFIKESPYGFRRFNDYSIYVLQSLNIQDKNTADYLAARLKASASPMNESSVQKTLDICTSFTGILLFLEKIGENDTAIGKMHRQSYDNVKNIADYINEKFMENIDGKSIEKMFSINYDYANRIFKQYFGLSINRYRNQRRIDRAKFLLATTDKTLEEIAQEIGFDDKYYFSRLFAKYEGISPLNYRSR
ncbi:MAG: AraC family transcriptional regulator [Acutalibacteraceae bacterium]|nr:AraC family transcriptional regulator [Acutalibacteraceae bacterium]